MAFRQVLCLGDLHKDIYGLPRLCSWTTGLSVPSLSHIHFSSVAL